MIIGVPRERKNLEKRVALTPDGAHKLTSHGHKVLIEKDAGIGAHFSNQAYKDANCKIVETLEEVWTQADCIVKVKEPHQDEYQYFREGLIIFDYLHLASMPDLTKTMMETKVIGLAYELVQTDDGHLPLLEPMSEIAGKLSVLNGSYFLLSQNGGRGILPGGAIGVPRAEIVIIGAGIAGKNACEIALGMGAHVSIFDINRSKLEDIKNYFGYQVTTLYSTPAALSRACKNADMLIGAVLIPGAAAPKIITRDMIKTMKKGAVFVDISIDQGGCAETSRPTTLDDPIYIEEDVIHYGVCNMPAQTARTSTMALTSATLPYIIYLADNGLEATLKNNRPLQRSVNLYKGHLTNKLVSEATNLPYTPIEEAISAI